MSAGKRRDFTRLRPEIAEPAKESSADNFTSHPPWPAKSITEHVRENLSRRTTSHEDAASSYPRNCPTFTNHSEKVSFT